MARSKTGPRLDWDRHSPSQSSCGKGAPRGAAFIAPRILHCKTGASEGGREIGFPFGETRTPVFRRGEERDGGGRLNSAIPGFTKFASVRPPHGTNRNSGRRP